MKKLGEMETIPSTGKQKMRRPVKRRMINQSLDMTAKNVKIPSFPHTTKKGKVEALRHLVTKNSSIDSLAETVQMKDREKARIGHGHLSYLMNRDVPQLVQPRLSGMESTCEKPRSMLDNYHIDRRLTTGSMTRSMLGS
jgi:hypothetical protein